MNKPDWPCIGVNVVQKAAGPSEDPSNQYLHDATATSDEGTYA